MAVYFLQVRQQEHVSEDRQSRIDQHLLSGQHGDQRLALRIVQVQGRPVVGLFLHVGRDAEVED